MVYVPDLDAADRLAERLARIGNIASDGRPILGLDSRHLLEIVLETSPDAYLVPAHIWTPWFAVLGSRSGFDSVAECYGDLADNIFAVETGLSSDPPMNWRLSMLDHYRLVSNSDAHSPAKLGREATLFDTGLDYFAMRQALATGQGYVGTVEFFPEEGKYHLDGHRKCGVRLSPQETREAGGRCPTCAKPVTVGVLHRLDALADRSEAAPPATAGQVSSLVPLGEIISEIVGTGPTSRKVERVYERLVSALGPELAVLETVPLEDVERAESQILAEALARLRAGNVIRSSGYDGEYGVIRLFEEAELRRRTKGGLLFDLPESEVRSQRSEVRKKAADAEQTLGAPADAPAADAPSPGQPPAAASTAILARLDAEQRAAAAMVHGPLLIVAGPGSGKTRTLTHRIAHLVADHGVPAPARLAITFTRRAAAEMSRRLGALLPEGGAEVPVHTFHSLGLMILREHPHAAGLAPGFAIADEDVRAAALAESLGLSGRKARALLRAISKAKRSGQATGDEMAAAMAAYGRILERRNWVDLDDLIGLALKALRADAGLAALYRKRFAWISVDEFQDLDAQQYALVKVLAPAGANLCVIGDADQAIYGFRGADAACFERFAEDYGDACVVRLRRNYRSSGTIVRASAQVIAPAGRRRRDEARAVRDMAARVATHTAPTERAEAEFVVHTVERMIGGHSFFSIDSGRAASGQTADLAFSDFAVLYRTDAQSLPLCEAFERSGMPFKKHSHERLADRPGVQALMRELGGAADGDERPLAERLRAAAERLMSTDLGVDGAALEAALQLLKALAAAGGDDSGRFAEAVALAADVDGWDPRADRISLLTLHAAKGLEFRIVFIVGLEDGIVPLHWGEGDDTEAEERRLFYVGMTRAEDRLFLSRAKTRRWRGSLRRLEPSPYLRDIESALLEHGRAAAKRRRRADEQLEMF